MRRVATLDGPRNVESRAGAGALVGHASEGAVTLLDGAPVRVRRVLRGFGEPRYAAIAPDGRTAFVTDSAHGELAVVDLRRGRVVHRLEVGAGARHVTLDPAGRTLWIALGSTAVDARRRSTFGSRSRRASCGASRRRSAHTTSRSRRAGRRVWITGGRTERDRAVSLLRAAAGRRHRRRTLRRSTSRFGPRAAVRRQRSRVARFTVHALDDGRVLRSTQTPLGSYNVARGARRVVTPSLSSGELTVLDDAGGGRWSVPIAGAAHDACLLSGVRT